MKILLFLVVVTTVLSIRILPNRMPEFKSFMEKYNKNYSPEEFARRFSIFQQNMLESERLNRDAQSKGLNTKFGVTKFSDLTKEEFSSKYFGYKEISTDATKQVVHSVAPLPNALDWRTKGAVTAVKDQQQCGSCWAFSATEGIESAYFLAKGQLYVLSPQQIVSCDTSDGGCNGGDLPTAFQYVQQAGIETDSAYPYTSGNGDNGNCNYDQSQVVVKISGFKYATTTGNETEMQAAMVNNGPLSVCVDAETWQNYQGGVITHGCGDSLDHCVQIVGWDSDSNTPYWIVRNSWGTDWGLNGFLWVERNLNECGISDEATYVTI